MTDRSKLTTNRYWVLGGRWADDARHLPWPRVYGPYTDYGTAVASANDLNVGADKRARYLVVADVTDLVG